MTHLSGSSSGEQSSGRPVGSCASGMLFFILMAVYSAIMCSSRPEDGDKQKLERLGARLSFAVCQHRS